jgi:hypothetical protein
MNLGNMGRFGFVASLLAAAWGCSDMASPSDTYDTVYPPLEAAGAGGGGAGGTDQDDPVLDSEEWGCLKIPPVVVPRGPQTRILYRVPIGDFDSSQLIPNLSVQACTTTDCDPVAPCPDGADPTPTQPCAIVKPPSAALPLYEINLPYGFSGGLKLSGGEAYVEMDYLFGGPMIGLPELALADGGNVVVGLPIPVIKVTTRARVYREVMLPSVDTTRGVVAVRTLNCYRQPPGVTTTGIAAVPQGQRAQGVALQSVPDDPAGAVSWTLSNGNAFSPNRLVTDARGVAGFLNAPSGNTDLFAVLPGAKTTVPTNLPVTIFVRPDVIILAELRPGNDVWGQ